AHLPATTTGRPRLPRRHQPHPTRRRHRLRHTPGRAATHRPASPGNVMTTETEPWYRRPPGWLGVCKQSQPSKNGARMETDDPHPTETSSDTPAPASLSEASTAATETTVTHRDLAEWHGKQLIDSNGERIGKLQDVYVDTETDEPQFATVKEGFIERHLTF